MDPRPPALTASGRRQSVRWLVAAVALAGALVVVGGLVGYKWWVSSARGGSDQAGSAQTGLSQTKTRPAQTETGSPAPWFGGYVDVTLRPAYDFGSSPTRASSDVVLFSIVSSARGGCIPTWGAAFTLDQAAASLALDRLTARLRSQGRGVAVSFGGQLNDELATTCSDVDKLAAAYASVVDRYQISMIDLDVEGAGLRDRAAGQRRATAIKKLQMDRSARGKPLAVWMTLPVSPNGLTEDGRSSVAEMLTRGVDLAGVNAMTMNYSASRVKGQSMLEASTSALRATHRDLKMLYLSSGINLSDPGVWSKIGATPMIGRNDVPNEVFDLDAARSLNAFVTGQGIGRVSMWSLNRDIACGPGQIEIKRSSPTCSGVSQRAKEFADLLAADLGGRLDQP